MSVEDLMTDELHSVATGVPVPPPPAEADLVELARRERSRRRTRVLMTTGLVAAAVAAAVLLGSQVGRPDASPAPTPPTGLPTGAPPRIPYLVGETLYMSGQPVAGEWWDVQTAQGATVATRGVPPIGIPVLFKDGRATHLLDHALGTARLSIEGTKVAWAEQARSTAHLVVYDLVSGHELGRLQVPPKRVFAEEVNREWIRWLSDDGTVMYDHSGVARRWKPDGPPTPFTSGPQVLQGWIALGVRPEVYPVDQTELAFSPDGNWVAWRSDRSGSRDDHPRVHDAVMFEATENPDTRFATALPRGTDVQSVTWESATDVLLRYDDRPGATNPRFLRCSVIEDRRCELVPTQADP